MGSFGTMEIDPREQLFPVMQDHFYSPLEYPPQSLAAAVYRYTRSTGLGTTYVEAERRDPGMEYRFYWVTNDVFGTVSGTTTAQEWNNKQAIAQEPPHSILGTIRSLRTLSAVMFEDPEVHYDGFDQTINVDGGLTLIFDDSAEITVPKFKVPGSGAIRDMRDKFVDAVLAAHAGRSKPDSA